MEPLWYENVIARVTRKKMEKKSKKTENVTMSNLAYITQQISHTHMHISAPTQSLTPVIKTLFKHRRTLSLLCVQLSVI